jgi:hypothetical protein
MLGLGSGKTLPFRCLAVALTILVIFSSAAVPKARSNLTLQLGEWTTSVTDLRYSAEVVRYVETPWVEATVTYQNAPTGWYLAVAVIDLKVLESRKYFYWLGDINTLKRIGATPNWVDDSRSGLVKGTASGTPVECSTDFPISGGSMPMIVKGYTWCVVPIGGSARPVYLSGQENVRFQLSDLGLGFWHIRILSALCMTRGAGFGLSLRTVSFRDFFLEVVTSRTTTTTSRTTVTTPPPTSIIGVTTATSLGASTASTSWETTAATSVWQVSDSLMIAIAIVTAGVIVGLSVMLALRRKRA